MVGPGVVEGARRVTVSMKDGCIAPPGPYVGPSMAPVAPVARSDHDGREGRCRADYDGWFAGST